MSRRWAVVLSGYAAVPPPGIDAAGYATAALTDSYEVIAQMTGLSVGLAGDPAALEEIRWPQDALIDTDGRSVRAVADRITAEITAEGEQAGELIVIAGDVPDLPEMIVAKIAKALGRSDAALAPDLGDEVADGLAALGVRLPWPDWLPADLDLDHDPYDELSDRAPKRNLVVRTAGWHRMRRPDSVHRLDPGLEGWDNVRLLLSGIVR